MTNCTFHPERDETGQLVVYDELVGGKVYIPICDDCKERYTALQQEYIHE